MNEAVRRAGVFLAGVVVALLLLEGGLRVQYALRQDREERRDPRAKRTVLCIGDSFVYGIGAPREKSFPRQLQQLLGEDYSVINLGMGGANTANVLEGLRDRIRTVNPDVVVILCGGSNCWNLQGSDGRLARKSLWGRIGGLPARTRTGQLVKLLWISLKGRMGQVPLPQRTDDDGRPRRPGPEKRWPDIPEFAACTDAETAAWRARYEKGIRSDPSDAGNYQGLGMLCLSQREYEDAIRHFKAALRIEPGDTFIHIKLAKAYDETGRFEEAAAWLQKAIELDPDEYRAYDALGYVYDHMFRDADALRSFRRSLELYPPEGGEIRYKGLVLLSCSSRNEEVRREAQRLLREYAHETEAVSPTLMRLISDEHGLPPEACREWIRDDIEEMVGICRERHAAVVILNYPAAFEGINDILRDIAQKNSLPFVDNALAFHYLLRNGEASREDYFVPDGHCNAAGYGVMARNVYQVLLRSGYAEKHEQR